jgi:hypothetical protein
MSVAAFLGFSASFVPFTIVVAAIAISVIQRNIRAPVMFAGIIISALLLSAFLQALYGFLEGRAGAGGGGGGAGGGGVLLEALRNVATQGNGGCDTLILPYISSGMIPRANAFFMAWVTAYLAWSQSQWDHKGGTPVNPFVWTGIALAWGLIAYSWRNEYPSDAGPQTCGNFWPGGVISLVSGTILGLGYGALIGAIQPTALYFAPLASDNVVCTAPRRQVFSCTIGSGTPPS